MKNLGEYIPRFLLAFLLLIFAMPLFSQPVHAVSITSYPAPVPQGQVGSAYSVTLTANGVGPFTWGTAINVPPGLTAAGAGANFTINGTPTTAGSYAFSVTVTDTGDLNKTSTLNTTITINQKPLTFSTTSIPTAKEGVSYSATISISGGTSPYGWSIASGSLPSGLVMEGTYGYITGTPHSGTAGTYNFVISVTDSSSPAITNTRSYTIYVEKGTYETSITIGAGLKAGKTKIYADGDQITSLEGGDSVDYNFDLGDSVAVSVEPTIIDPTNDGIRYKAEDTEIIVNSSQTSALFNYYTEYYVDIKTDPYNITTLSGTGWYQSDKTVNINAEEEVEGDPGTVYRFSHWELPSSDKINTENASYTVENPAILIAHYDTYYQLNIQSVQGETTGAGWYKKGSTANWKVADEKVSMSGLIGLFQGKYKAVNPSGSEIMDGPKSVTVFWEADYSLPYVLIPLTIILLIAAVYGIYWLMRRSRPPTPSPVYGPPYAPRPMPPLSAPPRPIPQHHTTVVMIGDKGEKQRQLPQSTKEQLLEKFGELLETYENEIKSTMADDRQLGAGKPVSVDKRLSAPRPIPRPIVDEEEEEDEREEYKAHDEEEEQSCEHVSKKLLRTITGSWRQSDSKTVELPSTGKEEGKAKTGLAVVWARDIYQEWEIQRCALPHNHKGNHKGDIEIVYTLLNTVTEEKTYSARQKMLPPKSHFTDGMDQEEIPEDQIIPADELPQDASK